MENLNTALTLLAVGMGTVFFILFFIIYFSQVLIRVINRYAPEEVKEKKSTSASKVSEISPKIIAAISTAINVSSNGTAVVSKIEKIK